MLIYSRWSDNSYKDPTEIDLQLQLQTKNKLSDIWDGYIKFNFTKFDSLGNVFEPIVLGGGDVLRVRDLSNRAEADVVFTQRDGNDGTICKKYRNFSLGNVLGDNTEIEFIGDAGRADP